MSSARTVDSPRTGSELVTVIIPVHNRFDMVQRAIRSVRDQTHRPIELIVVDDASEPPLERDPGWVSDALSVRVLRLNTNVGPGAAREAARNTACGAFVAYLDSDDYWDPCFVDAMVGAMGSNPDAGMVYCIAQEVADGCVTGVRRGSDEHHETILPRVLWGRPWPTCGCLWRRAAADRIGPWSPLWCWEDYEYDCRAGCLDIGVAHVSRPLCFVEQDAPERLSVKLWNERGFRSRCAALDGMSRHLAETSWRSDEAVRRRMVLQVLPLASAAAEHALTVECRGTLTLLRQWCDGPEARVVVALCGSLIGIGRHQTAGALLRWFKRRVWRDTDAEAPGNP